MKLRYPHCVCLLAICAVQFAYASSSPVKFLDAEASDPRSLAWMQGTPPPPEKRITQPQSNYFSFPKLRWTVCHIRELLPTKRVSRGLGAPSRLDYALDPAIDSLQFQPLNQDETMSWRQSLDANYTDGVVVLHRGRIVYEYYSGCLNEESQHAAMSMTKSLTGLMAEILIAEGYLDETLLVQDIIPELRDSAFGSATVRQVMDMTTSLQYSEDYADPQADIWQYSAAASPLPKAPDYKGPNGYFEYLQTVKQNAEHGSEFGYKTINTDALGWVISRITGMGLAEFLSYKIWRKIGAEQDAYMTVDAYGTAFAGGGLSAGLRDLAKIGLLMLNDGKLNGIQVFPSSVLDSIQSGGDQQLFAQAGYKTLPGASYRSMWWVFHNQNKAFAARGVHGQTIYVDPTADMVIVRLSSYPLAKNGYIDPTSLPAYQALADYLMSKPVNKE
ncbi:serine hydrolase domain-containing protein [Alteromonas facilis]|uniref:serine hydrolase domain-containing protein n=1 Tax=Alteromonas facilis TaxID=2048004 RepID=UPI0013D9E144|nr:serine hydrolase [Alteromonas facilis]